MGLTILAGVVLIVGILLLVFSEIESWRGGLGVGCTILGGTALFIFLILIISAPYAYQQLDRERTALATTLEVARQSGIQSIEQAAILVKIAEFNVDLARRKYSRSLFWTSWFVSSKILTMDPIR